MFFDIFGNILNRKVVKTIKPMDKGIDLSHYQQSSQLNWTAIKAGGIDFCYLKCTQGLTFADPSCLEHSVKAKSVGIKVGYYHFATLGANAAEQAIYFNNHLETRPKADLLHVLDIETNKTGLSPAEVESWIQVFIDTMKGLGKDIMIYSYTPFLDSNLPTTHNFGLLPLWIAQYRAVASPQLPHGWEHATVWQYSNQAIVSGIVPAVDANKAITQNFLI